MHVAWSYCQAVGCVLLTNKLMQFKKDEAKAWTRRHFLSALTSCRRVVFCFPFIIFRSHTAFERIHRKFKFIVLRAGANGVHRYLLTKSGILKYHFLVFLRKWKADIFHLPRKGHTILYI